MRVLIAGGGVGGLVLAISLHGYGIPSTVFEAASEVRELGVGINLLPHAVRELAAAGLLPALDAVGIRTRVLRYLDRFGNVIWAEPRGLYAGQDVPQFSMHRGKLHGVLWRAAADTLPPGTLRTGMRLVGVEQHARGVTAIAGDGRGKLVLYPIAPGERPDTRLLNWVVYAKVADGSGPPPGRQDWSRPGRVQDILPHARHIRLPFIDVETVIRTSPFAAEYPMCDRDPLPWWTQGHATLLGDAAHPMYPVGSNGASQAILDARCLARLLAEMEPEAALAAYEADRLPTTAAIVRSNRLGGPERVIDFVSARAPDGFADIAEVASTAELAEIVSGYARTAGFAVTAQEAGTRPHAPPRP